MSFSVWMSEPSAREQDDREKIYRVGAYWVVTDQPAPTAAQVDAVLNPPPSRDMVDSASAKQDAKLTALAQMTPDQVRAWVGVNVTSLADAKDALATMAVAVSILSRQL